MTSLFSGRILVTDHYLKDDRDNVISNIVNHKSSRAAVYVLLKDFRDVSSLLLKFPKVIPFVIDPSRDMIETKKLLNVLPHMDHYVNFLGDQLAREFLGRRELFRIKDVSTNYVTDQPKIIDKVRESAEGIIFNVIRDEGTSGKTSGLEAKIVGKFDKSKNVLRNMLKSKSSSSNYEHEGACSETTKLLSNQDVEEEHGPGSSDRDDEQHREKKSFITFLLSILFFCFPCCEIKWLRSRGSIPLRVDQYPPDLDDRMELALQKFHQRADERWESKIEWAEDKKDDALLDLDTKIEQLKKDEIAKIKKKNEEHEQRKTTQLPDDLAKKVNAANERRDSNNVDRLVSTFKREKLAEIETKFSMDNFWEDHYQYVVEKQIDTVLTVWTQNDGNGCFG